MVFRESRKPLAILVCLVGLALVFIAPALASEDPEASPATESNEENAGDRVVWEDFPLEDQLLIDTDRRQRRELRRLANVCRQTQPYAFRSKHGMRACLKTDLDRVIRDSGNPTLIAYHWALPSVDRYNPERSSVQRARVADRARKIVSGEMEPPPFQP